MTNSTPKMTDKVERQASPNTGGKRQYKKSSGSIRSTTYFANGGRNSTRTSNSGRSSCSPPCQTVKNLRNSPVRNDSPRGSPTNSFYAGAKFSEPPSPASLPKPPIHWTTRLMTSCQQSETRCSISNHLKMILKVQA